jgi:hypothetical protein
VSVPGRPVHPCVMLLVRPEPTRVKRIFGASIKGRLPALHKYIRLERPAREYAIAYFDHSKITDKKVL